MPKPIRNKREETKLVIDKNYSEIHRTPHQLVNAVMPKP